VRVRTDVAAVANVFDYLVPPSWRDEVGVGTRVRVPLHGRSVRGWVVEVDTTPPPGVELLALKSWLGWGPPPTVVELSEWAAWRWAGPAPFFLRVASPLPVVRSLPPAPARPAVTQPTTAETPNPATSLLEQVTTASATILRLPPTTDPIDLVLAVSRRAAHTAESGSVLVLVPSVGWAERLAARLNRRGHPATTEWTGARAGWPIVVGSRSSAWAPLPQLAAVLVLDAHDPAYREQSAPTYSAIDVVVERAAREGSPCLLVSPAPPATLAEGRTTLTLSPLHERAGWAAAEVVDRRGADPRSGLFSDEFVRLARAVLDDPDALARGPLVCVYDRTGRARLLACARCGELARCTNCGAVMAQEGQRLHCPRCEQERPCVCAVCGRLKMKTLRIGVSRLREELAALLGVEVAEVSGAAGAHDPALDQAEPTTPVVLGTQAVLHRLRRAAAVAFLDLDLHLLAPRLDATDESLGLLVRASRLVGARGTGPPTARLLLQTRVPDHAVVQAALRGDPTAVLAEERTVRQTSALPPFSALALLSGALSRQYAAALREAAPTSVSVLELSSDRFLLRAPEHGPLCDLLAAVSRPAGRGLRVELDPTTL
jgi:primosomal protein N' (replication factor Y) (superfamily II helicase)